MISANILCGPWKEPFAEATFLSIQDLVDEIVVVDTSPGNNPNSEIIKKYADKIIEFSGGGTKDFSFAEARELARINSNGDWILRIDLDEVIHEKDINELKMLVDDTRYSAIEVAFYHFMVYPWLYQYIESKTILMRTKEFSWTKEVHEIPIVSGETFKANNIKYFHYGYCRGQEEVMNRWQLYVEIDGRSDWYKGVDGKHILDDRISVCQNYNQDHPKVVHSTLDKLFPHWREAIDGD